MNTSSAVTRSTLALALGCLVAGTATAQPMVNARVLSSTPVWEQVPVSDCGAGAYGIPQTSGGGAGIGAVMGGLIGSQMGRGSGHIAGAILGAVGGAMLGNVAEASQRGYHGSYPGGCATRYENRMSGYDVSYEVGGRAYRTRMAQDPGPWLQVPAVGMPGDPYYGQTPYGGAPGVQSYPVNPPPVAAYPLPAYPAAGEQSGVVVAPPVAYGGYPYPAQAYPPAYPAPGYPQPVYQQSYPPPAYPAAPVYVRPAPAYIAPIGVNQSIGGGSRGRGHWGVGIGTGF